MPNQTKRTNGSFILMIFSFFCKLNTWNILFIHMNNLVVFFIANCLKYDSLYFMILWQDRGAIAAFQPSGTCPNLKCYGDYKVHHNIPTWTRDRLLDICSVPEYIEAVIDLLVNYACIKCANGVSSFTWRKFSRHLFSNLIIFPVLNQYRKQNEERICYLVYQCQTKSQCNQNHTS